MKLLLDTHAFVWWTLDSPRLSGKSRQLIADADDVAVSIVTPWEIAIKVGAGKWPEAIPTLKDFEAIAARDNLTILTIQVAHVRSAGLTASPHRDPFDRLLAAQAIAEGLTLVTADARLAALGATVVW